MALQAQPEPRWPRLLLGFLAAPLLPVLLLGFLIAPLGFYDSASKTIFINLLYMIIIVAYLCTFVLGLPAYLVLRYFLRPKLVTFVLTGGLVAGLPWLLVGLDGLITWCGYLSFLPFVGFVSFLGAIGGFVFWLCAVWRGPTSRFSRSLSHVP